MIKPNTLCIVRDDNRILLGMKKRGFGEGRWNGFGGKLQANESIEETALRELQEEAGIIANDLKKLGMVDFRFEGKEDVIEVHIFIVRSYQGEPIETEEMRPNWFNLDSLPFSDMWPADRYWLPLLLSDKYFLGEALFDREGDVLKEYSFQELPDGEKLISSL